MKSIATKKFGNAFPIKLQNRSNKSGILSCFIAERIPSGIEIITVKAIDNPVKSKVAGSLERNVENTSAPLT